ncbi:MFS transporter [Streptomyces sp. HSW2009]|uniref:MFS transporter n=1 Tax=Streptomyces sp. HSW2009 TaxID=3142890 RepID=UPI0032EF94D7
MTTDGPARAHVSGGDDAAGCAQTKHRQPSEQTDRPATGIEVPADLGARIRRGAVRALVHPVGAALALAGVLHLLWVLLIANSGGDLAAQDAWATFATEYPGYAYNFAWFGGMHPVSYSVISPYLMAEIGVRTTMVIVGTLSAGLVALLLVRSRAVRRPMLPALYAAVALTFNAVSGRVTFGLGLMFGLAAVAVIFAWPRKWRSRRWSHRLARGGAAATLSALATLSSPVAGLYVGIVAAALWVTKRRPAAYALGVTPSIVVALSAWLFPFSGTMPMDFTSVIVPLLSAAAAYFFAPKQWRTVRVAALLYGLAVVLVWAIPSQIGSNITRFGMIFGGVVLLAVVPPFKMPRLSLSRALSRKWAALTVAIAVVAIGQASQSTADVIKTTPSESWGQDRLQPLLDQLDRAGAERGRVEVVPAQSHVESSAIAPHFNLARGWNRQADKGRNPIFYEEDRLTPDSYRAWLGRWAVHFVVLPKDRLDGAGEAEAKLVSKGLPYLDKVWADENWKLYRVVDPTPMAEGAATVTRAGAEELTIDVRAAGPVLIRVPYSPWLGLIDGKGKNVEPPRAGEDGAAPMNTQGCLTKEVQEVPEGEPEDEWTVLHAPKPGTYHIGGRYKFPRGTACPHDVVESASAQTSALRAADGAGR